MSAVQELPATPSRQGAFTLIELLVAIAVMGVLLSGMLGFLGNFLTLKFNAEARLRIREEGNYALDRIEYLVRNSITIPDICDGLDTTPPYTRTYPGTADISLKFNLRDENYSNSSALSAYIHRMRVTYFKDGSNDWGELVEFMDYPTGCTSHSGDTASPPIAACSFPKSAGVNLTRMNPGSTSDASERFKVSGVSFTCTYDNVFLDNYSVKVKFDITYKRRSLSATSYDLTEHFERDIAVRNTAAWRD